MDGDSKGGSAEALLGKRVAFVGKLGAISRKEAQQLVRAYGGVPLDGCQDDAELIVIGAENVSGPPGDPLHDPEVRRRAAKGGVEVLTETQLWERLGFLEDERFVRRLFTPAMLAGLLQVPIALVRRWYRRGFIVPQQVVHRLPYFDFHEIATARQLSQLHASGISPAALERKLAELAHRFPDIPRPLAQLAVVIDGRQLLLRQGEQLVEPSGQLRLDFDAAQATDAIQGEEVVSLPSSPPRTTTPHDLLEAAVELEDQGNLRAALEMYRAALAAGGPQPEICFQLAELLYRMGDLSAARERYYVAIEVDDDFVEARANLGCILAELGETDLALAAFAGALAYHPDYPDAHYHLARTLDDLGRTAEGRRHWQQFLCLAPQSPWADEARQQLAREEPL